MQKCNAEKELASEDFELSQLLGPWHKKALIP